MTRRATPVERRWAYEDVTVLQRAFDFRRRMKWQSWLVVAGFGLAIYFGYHAVNGNRGLLASERMEAELKTAEKQLADLERERAALERRVERLRPESLDPDLIDELARDMLSMAEPDDVIILLEPSASSASDRH
ncbi:MAG: FtsB family cell division protein [Geminicoccaceae bacterium]